MLVSGLFLDWRWLAITSSIPPTLMLVCMCFMPETPRYLLSRGKRNEAEEALRFLRGRDAPVEWECARIEAASRYEVRLYSLDNVYSHRIVVSFIKHLYDQICSYSDKSEVNNWWWNWWDVVCKHYIVFMHQYTSEPLNKS